MIETFLAPIRAEVESGAPQLLSLFDVMAGEARFARWWMSDDLARLPKGAPILEVGGGAFLLASLLAHEGWSITTIEPTGSGFDALGQLGEIVLARAKITGALPRVIRCKAEQFTADDPFDFAFSVNVMEHVDSPAEVIRRVADSLAPGGGYRFLCPNYLFPYEPHFNMPTLGTKSLTERVMGDRIRADTRTGDPIGVWRSLNWITVPAVRRIVADEPTVTAQFMRRTLAMMLERATSEPEFASRRSRWMVNLVRTLKAARLLGLASWLPPAVQPIMDVRIVRQRDHRA